jgi:hypothetical protein
MFTPLDHPGIPLDRQTRHWHELDVESVDALTTDPFTQYRIMAADGIEAQAGRLDRQLRRRTTDPDVRRHVGWLGEIEALQRRVLNQLRPNVDTGLAMMIAHERAALGLVSWIARAEPDPDRTTVYERGALADFDRLYRYANLFELVGRRRADAVVGEVTAVLPQPSTRPVRQPDPGRSGADRRRAADALSRLHALTVRASEHQLMAYYRSADRGPVEPVARPLAGEVAAIARERDEQPVGTGQTPWARLVTHECAECYLYYSFMQQETDPRTKAVWELLLQMELAHLRAAGELLRTVEGRDPHEVVDANLPEPAHFDPNAEYLSQLLATRVDPATVGTGSAREAHDRMRWSGGKWPDDVVDVLTTEHARIENLFSRTVEANGHAKQAAFGALVRLVGVHEIVEEELIHPLVRRIEPDDELVLGMLEEERRVSDMLGDLTETRMDDAFDIALLILRDEVVTHFRHEERTEFLRLRRHIPTVHSRALAAVVRTAENASVDPAAGDGPAAAPAVQAMYDQVRDAVRGASR